jgi:NNP family nitrate/nitrite transporter-like MFS transporter
MLKSVPIKANIKQQFDIFKNQDTWWMTILYIMTFGTFSGLSAQFGLLMINLYGAGNPEIVSGSGAAAKVLVAGYAVPEAVKFVFLGPLIGAVARFAFSPLTDRMGGAIWTLISGVGLIGSIIYTIPALTPDTSSAAALDAGFNQFLYGMLAIFLFAGIGNASTFKQMPMIFEKRQAGGVIGWTAAIAAFGPFLFGMGINFLGAVPFYWIGVVWAVGCVALTWWRYARKGAPKPS